MGTKVTWDSITCTASVVTISKNVSANMTHVTEDN